ncbi:Hsp60 family chaperonin [Desulfitobacterium chlororespirans]|nr:molecular chaperone GroEL [Desulfitobacterium chlororespirans]
MERVSLCGAEARQALIEGINGVADCVRITLGPKGRNVALGPLAGRPKITNDGASIAGIISVPNRFHDLGCQIIREVAEKTNDLAGDGTTTAVVLAQAMIKEGMKQIAAGVNPTGLIQGLEQGVETVIEAVQEQAVKITELEQVAQVAAISSGDPVLGKLLAEAVGKIGFQGIITIEEGKGLQPSLEIKQGISFNKGCFTPKIVKSWERKSEVLTDAFVLIVDGRFSTADEIFAVLQLTMKYQRPLLLIAEDIGVDLLALLLTNKQKGTMNAVAVQSPGSGERRKEYLQDIAVLTGGTVIGEENGILLEEVAEEHLGQAKKILANNNSTTIIGGTGDPRQISLRCSQVRQEYEGRLPGWRKDKLAERLGWLQGGVAVVYTGAPTRLELQEQKDRLEDAVNSVRVAISEGIVPGGGTALLEARRSLTGLECKEKAANTGLRILYKALEAPLRQIAVNAGSDPDAVLEMLEELPQGYGHNAAENRFVHMLESGISDPAQVTCTALRSAVSIAALVIGTGGLVIRGQNSRAAENQSS